MAADTSRRRWKNTRIEREWDPNRARWMYGALLGLVVAALPVALWVLQQNECTRLNYELTSVKEQCEDLHEAERRLNVERAEQESLDQVERWAARQQGMQLPASDRVVVVNEVNAPAPELVASAPVPPANDVR